MLAVCIHSTTPGLILPCLNVVKVDVHVVVPVRPLVLVVEAKRVQKLVHDRAMTVHAAADQGHTLGPADHADVRRAARAGKNYIK